MKAKADLQKGRRGLADKTTTPDGAGPLNRRAVLLGAAWMVGARPSVAAPGKRAQGAVGYQNHPNGIQRCEICAPFLPPDQCQFVVGPVSRQGWCRIYVGPANP